MGAKQNLAEKQSLSIPKKVWSIIQRHAKKDAAAVGRKPNNSAAACKLIVAGDEALKEAK